MMRLLVYLLVFGGMLYLIQRLGKTSGEKESPLSFGKIKNPFRPKIDPREVWMQVYETESIEEARAIQARIQEDEIECVVYEQGKRDIHGNLMKGVGIVVPKTAAAQSQRIISRALS